MVRQAGQRTHRNQWPAVIAAPIVGDKAGVQFLDGPRRREAAGRHRHCSIAFVSAQGGDSAISLCRCICWCPTFVRQIATTRNAIFPYARRGPDTKQTSDAIQAKISTRAFFISTTWGVWPLTPVAPPKLRPPNFALGRELQRASNRCLVGLVFLGRRVASKK
jgi:hypothetical protein